MIALGADHGGYALKEEIRQYLDERKIAYKDFGTYTDGSVDYPDMAVAPCNAVVCGECDKALLFCGTGVGISMAANKIKGIRACCCSDAFSAKYTRLHNDANALCLGGRVVGAGLAIELVELFLSTPFEGGRHARRVAKIMELEH
ncbi:MAG: ribose 5-phosphate isomerase B [Pygmaiobacter sp.]